LQLMVLMRWMFVAADGAHEVDVRCS